MQRHANCSVCTSTLTAYFSRSLHCNSTHKPRAVDKGHTTPGPEDVSVACWHQTSRGRLPTERTGTVKRSRNAKGCRGRLASATTQGPCRKWLVLSGCRCFSTARLLQQLIAGLVGDVRVMVIAACRTTQSGIGRCALWPEPLGRSAKSDTSLSAAFVVYAVTTNPFGDGSWVGYHIDLISER